MMMTRAARMPVKTQAWDDNSAASGKWVGHTQVRIAPRPIGQNIMANRLPMNRMVAETRRCHVALRDFTRGCRREANDSRSWKNAV